MNSPVFIPLAMAAAMCMVCACAGGNSPQTYFQEWQPASVYNALQLFFCSFVAAAIVVTRAQGKASALSAAIFWSIVCGACAYFGFDELFQFHENSGPLAQSLSEFMGQPGRRPVVAGFELASYRTLVEAGYAVFALTVALLFRRELLSQRASLWMFALAALFLGGSQLMDYAFLQGHYTFFVNGVSVSEGLFRALAQSLKLAGFATVLGALMETLLAKRQRLSVEKMLSTLSKSSAKTASPVN